MTTHRTSELAAELRPDERAEGRRYQSQRYGASGSRRSAGRGATPSAGPRCRVRPSRGASAHRLAPTDEGADRQAPTVEPSEAVASIGIASGSRPKTGSRPSRTGERRLDEPVEQRVRPLRPGLELGVELAGHEPRVVLELDDLDEPAVGRLAAQQHARRLERLAVAVVHLEAVAVALVDDLLAVDRGGLRAGRRAGPGRGPRRIVPPLSSMSRWSGMKSMTGCSVNMSNSVELASLVPDHLAGELDDRALQPEAQPEVRDLVVAGEVGGEDLALDAAMAEAARDEDPGRALEPVVEVLLASAPRSRPSGPSRRRRGPRPRGGAPR